MTVLASLRPDAPWLSAGALMAFGSSFGQTFFIAAFAGVWREEFALSHGDWGAIYMAATLASAVALTQAGRLADVWRARPLALAVLVAFALVAVGLSFVTAWWTLALLIFGLRFCGQGMLSHIAMTSMGKWFRAKRARAIAIATLGFSLGEAVLPAGAIAVIGLVGWRDAWLLIASALVFVFAPLLAWLLRRERRPLAAAEPPELSAGMDGRHWTRSEMVSERTFWALVPGLIGPAWIGTVVFFQTVHLTEVKGWDLAAYAALAFPAYSLAATAGSFGFGWAADRFGVARLLPVYLLGWAAGAALMGLSGGLLAGVIALAVGGIGSGAVSVVHGAVTAELYGTRWLGGVKALTYALAVLASALGPGLSGALLDAGVGFEAQCAGMAAYLLAVSLWFIPISARTRLRLARP